MTNDKRQILIFVLATFALSWLVMGVIIARGGMTQAGPLILVTMWVPGLVALILRTFKIIGGVDGGWKPGGGRFWLLAAGVPLLVAAIAYGISWATGVSAPRAPPAEMLERSGVASAFALIATQAPFIFLIGYIGALGEEIGWRGFLVPKLVQAGVPRPLVASALIWGAWHLPLVLWGGYASSDMPALSAVLFMVMILWAGVFVGWLRLASGSVWVATMYHAAHNLFLQTAFETFNAPGKWSPILSGESGVIPCVVFGMVLGAGMWWMRRERLKRATP